jgi:hypothetical protein
LIWLAGDDVMKISELERMPIIDYWHLLDRKYAAAKRLVAELKKNKH